MGEKNIVLTGMMGCGKTTVGRLLSARLGRPLVDTDALIEEREGRSIPQIFAQSGEDWFRRAEQAAAEDVARRTGLIVACGGGLHLRDAAIAHLRASGTVLFLARDPGEIYDAGGLEDRPLAQEGRAAFLARFAQREPVYRRWAHHVITDFSSPEETMNAILEVLDL